MRYEDFEACIFDFDGVIIDSEPLHAEAKRVTLDRFQVNYPLQLLEDFKGRTDADFFNYVAEKLAQGATTAEELDAAKRLIYSLLFEKVSLVSGVLIFLPAARKSFDKLGLVTSAHRRDFALADRRYQISKWFDVIVTSEDTFRHKPDPEPYLKMMAALHVTGRDALVIEDSPNGIQSARSARCRVAALTTTFEAQELHQAGADIVVESFAALAQELGIRMLEAG
jgi:beta-phosphoglucomutase